MVDVLRLPMFLEHNNCTEVPCYETYVDDYLGMYTGR